MADHPNAAKLRAASEALEQNGDMTSQMDMLDDNIVCWAFSDDTDRINRFFSPG